MKLMLLLFIKIVIKRINGEDDEELWIWLSTDACLYRCYVFSNTTPQHACDKKKMKSNHT